MAEGIAIVVSILLAFSIQAAWERSQDRSAEAALASGLLHEFRSTKEQLTLRVLNHERLALSGRAVSDLLITSEAGSVTVPDSLLVSLWMNVTFDPTLGVLEEAQSSGRTALIRDAELRALLGAWPGHVQDARNMEDAAIQLWTSNFLESWSASSPALAELAISDVDQRWFRREVIESSSRVDVSPRLALYSANRAAMNGAAASLLAQLAARADSIISLLEQR